MLLKGKKKPFDPNMKAEMADGAPKDNLAIAMSVQRKNKKKMASGGTVKDTVEGESRPMPDQRHNDAKDVSQNSTKKPLMQSDWNSQPERRQAGMGKAISLSSPRDMGSDALAERQKKMRMMERDLEGNIRPAMASGGIVDMQPEDDEVEMMERHNESHLQNNDESLQSMNEKAHAGDAPSPDEQDPHTGETESDMLRRHAMERAKFAKGGEISPEMDEMAENDKPSTVAEHIMMKRADRKRFADGGEVSLEDNSREDKNNEDDYSFDALLKEQYDDDQLDPQPTDSNEHGHELSDEDSHDHIDIMRRKIKARKGM